MAHVRSLLPVNKGAVVPVAIAALAQITVARDVYLVAMLKPSVVSMLQSRGKNALSMFAVPSLGMSPLQQTGMNVSNCG